MKHLPRKRFGQNFLTDENVVYAIVTAIAPRAQDRMVEIGPGLAALTAPLLEYLDHMDVVEIDRDLIAGLKKRFSSGRLTIHEGDALAFDFARLSAERGGPLRIVGNLPYNISTPLLFYLSTFADHVIDMHFMLQREVVERMVAAPGESEYGRLSVMLQYRFNMAWVLDVPPEAFHPAPKVESAVVRLGPRPAVELAARDEALFARLVSAAFSQRRKMLRNTLRDLCPVARLEENGISPTARAEEIAVADYVRLANTIGAIGA